MISTIELIKSNKNKLRMLGLVYFIMSLVKHLPYLLLIAVNLVYLWVYGFKPIRYQSKLALYNFLIFLLIGIVIFFKASYLLHNWFVKGEGDVREKVKIKLQEILRIV